VSTRDEVTPGAITVDAEGLRHVVDPSGRSRPSTRPSNCSPGVPAGEPGADGAYAEASLHGRVHARIAAYAALARNFGQPARPEPTLS
jgi:hypothetical protein